MLMPADEDGEFEVVAFLDGDSRDATGTTFSRSLIDGASRGDVACLLSSDAAGTDRASQTSTSTQPSVAGSWLMMF